MHPTDKAARVAGAVYLSMVVTAPFSLIYIPSTLIVRGNATATANNILAHETLFRPSPNRSQAKPTRGAKFLQRGTQSLRMGLLGEVEVATNPFAVFRKIFAPDLGRRALRPITSFRRLAHSELPRHKTGTAGQCRYCRQ